MKTVNKKEIENSKTLIVIYGEPGSGKSHFALDTNRKTHYVQIMDDGGIPEDIDNDFDVSVCEDANIASELNSFVTKMLSEKNDIDTIIFDPFNFIEDKSVNFIGKGQTLTINQWGELQRMCITLIKKINTLRKKYNIVIVLHSTDVELSGVNGTTTTKIIPDLRPKVRQLLLALANDVVFCAKENDKYIKYVGSHNFAFTKHRQKLNKKKGEHITIDMLIEGEKDE